MCLAVGAAGAPAGAQDEGGGGEPAAAARVADVDLDGPAFPVSRFDVRYHDGGPDLPPVEVLLDEPVRLVRTPSGWVAPRDGLPTESHRLPVQDAGAETYHASALGEVSAVVVARMRERGLLGVYVSPDPGDVDLESERDLRPSHDTVLRLVVRVGRVREMRSVGFGERLPEDWRINHPLHRRIREGSPLQPRDALGEDDPGKTSLVDRHALEDYLFRLNRHAGRQVDGALAPSLDGEGVALDYRVSEARPWYVYGQTSNTGTEETNEWQTRAGVVHRQLTNRDDVLSLEYLNAGLDDVNAFSFGYEAPWLPSKRPNWLDPERSVPSWLSWIPRGAIPWPGSDDLRFGLGGSWSRTKADSVDGVERFKNVEWEMAAELVYAAHQRRDLFLDVYASVTGRSLDTSNETARNDGSTAWLVLPRLGLRVERQNDYSSLFLDAGIEGNSRSLGSDRFLLGRIDPDGRWVTTDYNLYFSHFLEPLLFREAWEDPSTPESSTLAHELVVTSQGKYAFDYRLVPQAEEVVGGLFSVRGYDVGLATGDSIVTATLEYRFHVARSLPTRVRPARLPGLGSFRLTPQQVYGAADWDLVLSAFVDAGRTWRHDRPRGSLEQNDTLIGLGVGAELQMLGRFRARVDWARAMHSAGPFDDRTDEGDHEFHFLFSVLY